MQHPQWGRVPPRQPPSNGPLIGIAIGIALVLAFGGLGFFCVVMRMSGPRAATRAAPSSTTTAIAPRATSTPAASTDVFVVNGDHVVLYDSEESNSAATRFAVNQDRQGFARNILAHGVPVESGRRVHRLSGGFLTVQVETLDTGVSGWTDREFIRPE